jgi:hypothetical protein
MGWCSELQNYRLVTNMVHFPLFVHVTSLQNLLLRIQVSSTGNFRICHNESEIYCLDNNILVFHYIYLSPLTHLFPLEWMSWFIQDPENYRLDNMCHFPLFFHSTPSSPRMLVMQQISIGNVTIHPSEQKTMD